MKKLLLASFALIPVTVVARLLHVDAGLQLGLAAVVVAARGELKLAADIGLESAAQVAALVIPAVAILSWLIEPFPLAFSAIELIVLVGAVTVAALLLYRGRSTRTRGVLLAGAYLAAAAAFLGQ